MTKKYATGTLEQTTPTDTGTVQMTLLQYIDGISLITKIISRTSYYPQLYLLKLRKS